MIGSLFGRCFWIAAALPLGYLLGASDAFADPTPRAHDGGVFLRLSGGVGGASASIENTSLGKWKLSGGSGDINLAIGGTVSPNLILHGTIWGWSTSNPDVDIQDLGSGSLNGDLGMSAIGPGITYYFMPANIYFSGSLGVAWLSVSAQGESTSTKGGGAFDVTLGKEWWVGNSWGLGVAVGAGAFSIPEKDVDDHWNGGSVAVRFSATMN